MNQSYTFTTNNVHTYLVAVDNNGTIEYRSVYAVSDDDVREYCEGQWGESVLAIVENIDASHVVYIRGWLA